jgi:cytochrome c553
MISGQNAKYIVASLNAYKKGERKHPTMRGISASLSEQDMADLGAFYEQHAKVEPVTKTPKVPDAKVAALLQKGACISCHGDNFSKPIDPSYPKLAGQHKDFLFVALKSYKTENLSTWGRSNGVMGGIAKQFSNAELKAMAAYIGSLEGDMKVVPQSRLR